MGSYFVYILTNQAKTVLYTGVTNNLQRRISEHKSGQVAGFSHKYKTKCLVYYQVFSTPLEAIQAEKKIKGWTRAKEHRLISEMNPDWSDLSRNL